MPTWKKNGLWVWSTKNWKGKCPSFPSRSYTPAFMSFNSNSYCIFSGLVMRRHICVRPWNWINPTPIILWDSNQLLIKIQHIIWFFMDAKVLLAKRPFITAEVWNIIWTNVYFWNFFWNQCLISTYTALCCRCYFWLETIVIIREKLTLVIIEIKSHPC